MAAWLLVCLRAKRNSTEDFNSADLKAKLTDLDISVDDVPFYAKRHDTKSFELVLSESCPRSLFEQLPNYRLILDYDPLCPTDGSIRDSGGIREAYFTAYTTFLNNAVEAIHQDRTGGPRSAIVT